ncbi:TMV resistance protein N-like isoform X3 [Malus sylvestris]|uniref:TMV resistance protein N-like isoform X3 n=1 Tax=Malus sylvestris TaxID=3752 RepID=UPI0021ABDDE3|nr:TMV resistance protein N-like isoform X3 [Malus sylvestris]
MDIYASSSSSSSSAAAPAEDTKKRQTLIGATKRRHPFWVQKIWSLVKLVTCQRLLHCKRLKEKAQKEIEKKEENITKRNRSGDDDDTDCEWSKARRREVVDIASSSSSAAAPVDADDTKKYDVFISFRGEDTRRGITSHLHAALLEKKITTYIDDKLKRGDEIAPALLEAIEESQLSVIIFSKDYASSTWCLDELVHILECKEKHGQMVIPVFYDINPSDVRKHHGSYAGAFAQLEKRFNDSIDKVHKWSNALKNAADISGFVSKNYGTDADLVKEVVKDIWTKLCRESSCDLKGYVGIECRIKKIESLLSIHSPDACITVGIWGMGGIGKTTLAETVFHRLSSKFEASCFLKNVREKSEQPDGLDCLQKKLLSEIFKEEDLSIGSTAVRIRLSRTKVLVVLDDVSSSMQMERLAGDRLRYGTGSRIIITSRDRSTLTATVEEDNIYEVEVLKPDDALQLFCSRAFKNNSTCITDYMELAEKAVHYARGVPLALTVLGSLFFNCKSNKEDWEDEFNRLKRFPSEDIQKVLRISYDRLEENEKEIFLDIACWHKGGPVDEVKRMLDVRGFVATAGIRRLIDMSLISIDSNWGRETIEMHDLLQEMGRTIVLKDPGKRSRLFNDEDVYCVLRSNTETPNVEAIRVHWSYIAKRPLKRADFKVMCNLRLLIVYGGHKLNASLDLPGSLRYLYCDWYPLESLPSNFCPENLVELHLPYSNVKKLWREDHILVNLQVIDLRHSINLTEVPNLSGSLKIVHINLNGCFSLVEIPGCFQHLDKLTHLHLQDCTSLKYIPEMPGNIQHLNLRGAGIKELPESVWSNKNISYLNIGRCEDLEKLPSNNCELKVSNVLGIESCTSLGEFSELPRDITKLSLIDFKRLVSLPTHICKLKYLEELNLSGCSKLENFPEILEPMEHLVSLRLKETAVKMLPSPIENLIRLQTLDLSGCKHLKDVPDGLVCSTSLQELNLSGTKVRSIPTSIKQASRLSKLFLVGCKQLQSLPELPVLCNVEAEGCTSLKTVSSTRTALTQGWVQHDCFCKRFINCPKLDNNARSNIMEEAQIRIMREATSAPSKGTPWPEIQVVCQGKEIPNWFSYQNEGSSVNIKLRPDWFQTGLFGFALSAVVSGVPEPQCSLIVRANFIVKFMGESHELFTSVFSIPQDSRQNDSRQNDYSYDQYHVLVWNEAFSSERVAEKCSPNVYKLVNEASVDFYPVALYPRPYYGFAFEYSGRIIDPAGSLPPSKPMKVESCGIHRLYAEDVEKFKFDHVFMSTEPKVEEDYSFAVEYSGGIIDPEGSLPPSKPMKVESCGIRPLYAEDVEKFKFDHVFMSTEPKVEEDYSFAVEYSGGIIDPEGSLPPSKPMKVESCGIRPLYAEDVEKFKFDHVFMSTEPKVEEETRQDDDSEGGRSRDEPEACGSSEESEANDIHEYGSYGEACGSSGV